MKQQVPVGDQFGVGERPTAADQIFRVPTVSSSLEGSSPLAETSFNGPDRQAYIGIRESLRDLVQPLRPDPGALVTDLRVVSELLPDLLAQLESQRASAHDSRDFSSEYLANTLLVQFAKFGRELEPTINAIERERDVSVVPMEPEFWTAARQVIEANSDSAASQIPVSQILERLEQAAEYCATIKSPLALVHQN